MKILVTGGPVHANLDAVKIITNTFKGGLMAQLADILQASNGPVEVDYLTSKGSKTPIATRVMYHGGFRDYHQQVLDLAPQYDGVVLGAAVANLIPMNPFEGKFPSHNYKVGDRIPIDFTIAPRIIDEVKKVAPKTHLFGFKLLSGVPLNELITAAYGILLESHATAVFANDRQNLRDKYCVTKERGVHPMEMYDMAGFILKCLDDKYYSTVVQENATMFPQSEEAFHSLKLLFRDRFKPIPEGMVFGTIAIRNPNGAGFLTTARGKNELEDLATVECVDHEKRVVNAFPKKATLNAPLLDWIFKHNPRVAGIVHYHEQRPDLKELVDYAIPGTVADSQRSIHTTRQSFNIKEHGCFLLLDKDKNLIV